MGLWDRPFIGHTPSRKIAFLRYCEFHRIEDDRIVEITQCASLVPLFAGDGWSPIAAPTGLEAMSPGPRAHDGLLFELRPQAEGRASVELIAARVAELRAGGISLPYDHLERFWTPDTGWYAPGGIGASAFFAGYNRGHMHPFEEFLDFDHFTERVARLREGNHGGFFGYPRISLRSKGYLGLPASDIPADRRIVDLHRRDGAKLAENWSFIDLP